MAVPLCDWEEPHSHGRCVRFKNHPLDYHEFEDGVRINTSVADAVDARFRTPHGEPWFSVYSDGTTRASGDMPPLEQWWLTDAVARYEQFGPKLEEYGAHDLEEHGRAILRFRGPVESSRAMAGEVGCMLYLHGKLARAMEAYQRGDEPSDDTLDDIETYAKMARAYRYQGGLK